jgi:accessory gene regulator B
MKKELIRRFTYFLFKKKMFCHADIRKIRYGTEVIINEFLKLILLIALFILLGNIAYLFFSLFILLSIRSFSGGIHFNTNMKCFLFTAIYFIITCKFSIILPDLSAVIYYFTAMVCVVIIALLSPITSINRPIISKQKYQRNRFLAVSMTILWLVVLINIRNNTILFNCGLSTILLHTLQLSWSYISNKINLKRRIQNENIIQV